MDVFEFPDHFKFTAPSGWEGLNRLGLAILGVIIGVMLCREAINLIRGRPADWLGVVARGGIAGVMLKMVPWTANTLGGTAMSVGAMLHGEGAANMEVALRMAMGAAQCDGVGTLEALGMLFSLCGITAILSFIVFLGFMLVKIAVIDVGWKVMFSIVVFQAPLTLPLGTLEQFGGLSQYWRNVIGVAIWPITFGMMMAIATASFQNTINAMASGATTLECSADVGAELAAAEGAGAGAIGDQKKPSSLLGFVKFLGLLVGLAFFTWKVPEMSALIVGGNAAGTLGTGALAAILATSSGGAGAARGAARGAAARLGRST